MKLFPYDVCFAIFQEIHNDRQALGKVMQLTGRTLGVDSTTRSTSGGVSADRKSYQRGEIGLGLV
jgi:hypothetical protein